VLFRARAKRRLEKELNMKTNIWDEYFGEGETLCAMEELEVYLRTVDEETLSHLLDSYMPPKGEDWDAVDAFLDNLKDMRKIEAMNELAGLFFMQVELTTESKD